MGSLSFSLFHNREDQIVVEWVLVKGQEGVLLGLLAVNLHHVPQLEWKRCHDRILVLFNQLLSLGGLNLHRGSLLDSGVDVCSIREHVYLFVEGSDEGVSVHAADDIILRVFLHNDRHDSLKLLDVSQILSLLGIQMPRNQKVVVQEHDTSVLTPINQSKFLRCQPSQELLRLVLLLKTIPLSKNQRIFVRTNRNKIFVIELLKILDQQLIWFLNKDHISHRLIHALLELLQLLLFVQKRLLEKWSVKLQVFFCITLWCLLKVQNLEDLEDQGMIGQDIEAQGLVLLLLTEFRTSSLFQLSVVFRPQLSVPFLVDEFPVLNSTVDVVERAVPFLDLLIQFRKLPSKGLPLLPRQMLSPQLIKYPAKFLQLLLIPPRVELEWTLHDPAIVQIGKIDNTRIPSVLRPSLLLISLIHLSEKSNNDPHYSYSC